jgi:putative membrane protein
MNNNVKIARRAFISASVTRTAILCAALSPVGALLQSFSVGAKPQATTEAEFRTQLAKLGNKSLLTAQLAQTKASNDRVQMFASFEAAEQATIASILKEMGTPTPPPDTQAQALITSLKSASGGAFDKAFMKAQVDTHEALRTLTSGFVNSSKGKTSPQEMHTRHLASLALATITEHTERAKNIYNELG